MTLKEIQELIQMGSLGKARKELKELAPRVARARAWQVAQLARQAGLPMVSLRILNPIVRPKHGITDPASDREKAEYAASLIRVGASEEGLRLLHTLNPETLPEVYFYTLSGLFSQWNYKEALPLAEKYTRLPGLSAAEQAKGMLNWLAALVAERKFDLAKELAKECLSKTEDRHLLRYHSSALELSAQIAFHEKNIAEALKLLDRASQEVGPGSLYELYIRKWKWICLFSSNQSTELLSELEKLRADANNLMDWETVRDCDRWRAHFLGEKELLWHVYYGTAYETYRVQLLQDSAVDTTVAPPWRWNLGGSGKRMEIMISSPEMAKMGSLPYKLFSILVSDFYRPFSIATLHTLLYPEDYFNPSSSPAKVQSLVQRLRNWFSTHSLPLTIEEARRSYRLSATAPVSLLKMEEMLTKRTDVVLKNLRVAFGDNVFAISDAKKSLNLPERSLRRYLQLSVEQGSIQRTGKGAGTKYLLARKK